MNWVLLIWMQILIEFCLIDYSIKFHNCNHAKTGQGSSSLFGAANDDTTRSLIGDHAFENFEKGILADLFPSTTGTGHEDKLLDDFAEINTNTTNIR